MPRASKRTDQAGASVPAWQRGYALSELKRWSAVFAEHDRGYAFSPFQPVKVDDRRVAEALESGNLYGRLSLGQQTGRAVVLTRTAKVRSPILDFAGTLIDEVRGGDLVVERLGFLPGDERLACDLLDEVVGGRRVGQGIFLKIWQDHPTDWTVADNAGFGYLCSQIPASGEVRGVWRYDFGHGDSSSVALGATRSDDVWGLRKLKLTLNMPLIWAARQAIETLPGLDWADHYSSYNKRQSWSALSLRGYGPKRRRFAAVDQIVKPAEMSKAWKQANPDALDWVCQDTNLRRSLPALEPLIDAVPGPKQRIRLMRLTPGGGELTRHADIVDPDAGTLPPGKVLRIHVPIITNPDVRFWSWGLDGQIRSAVMDPGRVWYLDTRKPHRAVNGGETDRIHLVMDVYSNPDLLALVRSGREATVERRR